jgi:hypothetical protein
MNAPTTRMASKLVASIVLGCFGCANANANSPMITTYFGEWRSEFDGACSDKTNEPFLGFGYDGRSFVKYGDVVCELDQYDLFQYGFKVKDFASCEKAGFPKDKIGKYKTIMLGHLEVINQNLEAEIFKDCRSHR